LSGANPVLNELRNKYPKEDKMDKRNTELSDKPSYRNNGFSDRTMAEIANKLNLEYVTELRPSEKSLPYGKKTFVNEGNGGRDEVKTYHDFSEHGAVVCHHEFWMYSSSENKNVEMEHWTIHHNQS
jgi:hypothetical protein